MFKITSKIYIHFLTIIMLIICLFYRRLNLFLFTYAITAAHEAAHLIAAAAIGLQTDKIVFYPYGVNLKLKNKIVRSLADEIILYLAGPLLNCILALAAIILYKIYRIPQLQFIYAANIMLFVANMLPVYPLDGGIILKKILSHFCGGKNAKRIMLVISIAFSAAMTAFCIYTIYISEFNFSIILLTGFLLCSLFTQDEKYDVDFVKELMFYKQKKKNKLSHIIASEKDDYKKIAEKFKHDRYSIVYLENPNGKIAKILTEQEIMDKILHKH